MTKLMKKSKRGFTLVELVIVIAILAIVAAIAIPTASNVIGNANRAADNSNAQAIEMAIKTCESEFAAQGTNTSNTITNLVGSDGAHPTHNTVVALLNAYGVSVDLAALRQNNFHYFYNAGTGGVVAGAAGTTGIQLGTGSTYTLAADGTITIVA